MFLAFLTLSICRGLVLVVVLVLDCVLVIVFFLLFLLFLELLIRYISLVYRQTDIRTGKSFSFAFSLTLLDLL